jgi:hypothetical protein
MIKLIVVLAILFSSLPTHAIEKLKPFKSVQDFAVCGETHPVKECLKFLDLWLAKHNDDHAEAAKIVRKNASAELSVPYYRIAFRQRKVKCSDSEVLETVTTGLQSKPGTQISKDARSIAFATCWTEWKDDLIVQMEGGTADFLKNVCPDLLEKKVLNPEQTKICLQKVN